MAARSVVQRADLIVTHMSQRAGDMDCDQEKLANLIELS
jgi:hypothetical protein